MPSLNEPFDLKVLNLADTIGWKDVDADIPEDLLCYVCYEPLLCAIRGACKHRICPNCYERMCENDQFKCGMCRRTVVCQNDKAFSSEVKNRIEQLMFERVSTVLRPMLFGQLSGEALIACAATAFNKERMELNTKLLMRNVELHLDKVAAELLSAKRTERAKMPAASTRRSAQCNSSQEWTSVAEKSVHSLTIAGNWYTDGFQLACCNDVQSLTLSSCSKLHTLPRIDHLQSLTSLVLVKCGVRSLYEVSLCFHLCHLEVTDCPNFTGLALPLQRSETASEDPMVLRIRGCPKFLMVMPIDSSLQLREFTASRTAFDDLSPLLHCTTLEVIDLSDSKVTNLAALKKTAPMIKKLNLTSVGVSDISVLQHAKKLEELSLSNTKVADITPLMACAPVLRKLNIASTAVTNISALQCATKLEDLCLSNTKVTDLAPLAACAGVIEKLNLNSSSVSNISVLRKAKKLKDLRLSKTKVTDTSFFPAGVKIVK